MSNHVKGLTSCRPPESEISNRKSNLSENSLRESENLQQTCNQLATDCISRQAAIDAIADYLSKTTYTSAISHLNTGALILARVPSAQLPNGEWLRMSDLSEKDDDRYKCSRCGNVIHHKSRMDLYTFNSWCGRCGSDNSRYTDRKENR